jgi:predicted metal-dependent enzyme (double-stranded beta helix superfamily)
MFEIKRFIDDCRAAIKEAEAPKAVREVVAPCRRRSGRHPESTWRADTRRREAPLSCADLTIINPIWPARMTLVPHNHNVWAVIGVYTGREDNIFWRRLKDDPAGHIEAAAAQSLGPHDVAPLGRDIIHSVTNPTGLFTAAIHVYGGDFFAAHRSEWEPEGLTEQTYDVEKNMRLFEEGYRN